MPLPEGPYKIVADESVDYRIVKRLRELQLTVLSIAEGNPGIPDMAVLLIAVEEDALLITEDKDFGELVYRLKLPHRGILLIRRIDQKEDITPFALSIEHHYNELKNRFSVINLRQLRIK